MKLFFRSVLLAMLAPVIWMLHPANVDAQTQIARSSRSASVPANQRDRINAWAVGLAAGQLEGAPIRFAAEMARIVDDGPNMLVLPIVTRGPVENMNAMLNL